MSLSDDSQSLDIGTAHYKGNVLSTQYQRVPIGGTLAAAQVDATVAGVDIIVIALRGDGSIHVCLITDVESEYLAHLGFYHPSTDTLELIEMTELELPLEVIGG